MRRVLRYFYLIAAAVILAVSVGSVDELDGGYVLFHQKFTEISSLTNTGIKKGTDGAEGFYLGLRDGKLSVDNYNDRKAYVIFPKIEASGDYTVIYKFLFTDVNSANGYISFMLTCSGDEPINVTSAPIRANGKCDEFGNLGEGITNSISNGENVTVAIPVNNSTLHEMQVSSGGITETLMREKVISVADGNFGFVVRNASVAVEEIYIISGTDYDEMTGKYVNDSERSDSVNLNKTTAPQTEVDQSKLIFAIIFSGIIIIITAVFVKRKKTIEQ